MIHPIRGAAPRGPGAWSRRVIVVRRAIFGPRVIAAGRRLRAVGAPSASPGGENHAGRGLWRTAASPGDRSRQRSARRRRWAANRAANWAAIELRDHDRADRPGGNGRDATAGSAELRVDFPGGRQATTWEIGLGVPRPDPSADEPVWWFGTVIDVDATSGALTVVK